MTERKREREDAPVDADWSVERALPAADADADPAPLALAALVAPTVAAAALDLDLPVPAALAHADDAPRGAPPFVGREGARVVGQEGEGGAVLPGPADAGRVALDRALGRDGERGAVRGPARGVAEPELVERVGARRVEVEGRVGEGEGVGHEDGRVRDVGRVGGERGRGAAGRRGCRGGEAALGRAASRFLRDEDRGSGSGVRVE